MKIARKFTKFGSSAEGRRGGVAAGSTAARGGGWSNVTARRGAEEGGGGRGCALTAGNGELGTPQYKMTFVLPRSHNPSSAAEFQAPFHAEFHAVCAKLLPPAPISRPSFRLSRGFPGYMVVDGDDGARTPVIRVARRPGARKTAVRCA